MLFVVNGCLLCRDIKDQLFFLLDNFDIVFIVCDVDALFLDDLVNF